MPPVQPARTRPRSQALPQLAVAAALLSLAAIVVLAGIRPSPYSWKLVPGDGPAAPLAWLARSLGLTSISLTTSGIVGIVVMTLAVGAFLFALRVAWHGGLSVRRVLWFAVAFQVVFAALPLLLSQDVFSYAMYARIAAVHHANPYVVTPVHFPHDPAYPYVGWGWRNTPAVYGPAFTILSEGLARVIHSPLALVWSFKAVAAAAGIATLLIVSWTARRLLPKRAAFAVMLFGWNPAIVAYATGGGHNDMLVALAVAGAFAMLVRAREEVDPRRRRWEVGAVAVLTVGCLVKVAIAPALLLAMVATVAARPKAERRRLLVWELATTVVITVALAAPFWQTHDATLGLSSLVSHRDWSSPVRFLLATLGGLGDLAAGHTGRSVVEALVRLSMAAVGIWALAVVAMHVARRAARRPVASNGDGLPPFSAASLGAAWAWPILLFMLVSPVVLPWYVAWVLPVAWLMPRAGRGAAIAVAAILAATHTVSRPSFVPGLWKDWLVLGHDVVGPALFLVVVWIVASLEKMRRIDAPLEDPEIGTNPEPAVPAPVPARRAAG